MAEKLIITFITLLSLNYENQGLKIREVYYTLLEPAYLVKMKESPPKIFYIISRTEKFLLLVAFDIKTQQSFLALPKKHALSDKNHN